MEVLGLAVSLPGGPVFLRKSAKSAVGDLGGAHLGESAVGERGVPHLGESGSFSSVSYGALQKEGF